MLKKSISMGVFALATATLSVAANQSTFEDLQSTTSAVKNHADAINAIYRNTGYDWNAEHLQAIRDETNRAGQDLPHPDTRRVRGELMAEEEITRRGLESPGGDPRELIRRFPGLWPEGNRGGCVTVDSLSEKEGLMSVWGIFPYPEYLRDVGPSWIRQALLLAGARRAQVDYLGPGESDVHYRHRYWMAWEP